MPSPPVPFPTLGELPIDTSVRLQEIGPIVPVKLPGGVRVWAATRYSLGHEILVNDDKLFGKNPKNWSALHDGTIPSDWPLRARLEADHLQVRDGADHRRLRRIIARAFTTTRIAALEAWVEELAAGLLDKVLAVGDGADLVPMYTVALPIAVICELYGVPATERQLIRDWTNVLLSPISTGEQTRSAQAQIMGYLAELAERKRREPADDLATELVHAHDEGDQLSASELIGILWLMLIAGHETTVHLIGNAIVALCTHPHQLAIAQANNHWAQAVEETLRWRGSVITTPSFRYALRDVTLAGAHIPAGDPIMVCYSGAGRDVEQYGPTAAKFDITREQTGHLSLGYGPRSCIGAPLARCESRIALSALFTRVPGLRLAIDAEEIPYSLSPYVHGPLSLPVRLGTMERTAPTPA